MSRSNVCNSAVRCRYGNLTELNISVNEISQLPIVLKEVAHQLRVVVLSNNRFTKFPTNVFRDMPELRRMQFNGNLLTEFGFLNAKRLTDFVLSSNRIRNLGNIADCRSLRTLQVRTLLAHQPFSSVARP